MKNFGGVQRTLTNARRTKDHPGTKQAPNKQAPNRYQTGTKQAPNRHQTGTKQVPNKQIPYEHDVAQRTLRGSPFFGTVRVPCGKIPTLRPDLSRCTPISNSIASVPFLPRETIMPPINEIIWPKPGRNIIDDLATDTAGGPLGRQNIVQKSTDDCGGGHGGSGDGKSGQNRCEMGE